jgi:hypothetical protein
VLVTNLALTIRNSFLNSQTPLSKAQSSSESCSETLGNEGNEESTKRAAVKPALGAYWYSAAHHKILINFLEGKQSADADLEEINREVSLFQSHFSKPSQPIPVTITSKGVS